MEEEVSVGEDEYEEDNAEHDDDGGDDMEVDFMSNEVRKSGGGKA
jgi:hypothetical protein